MKEWHQRASVGLICIVLIAMNACAPPPAGGGGTGNTNANTGTGNGNTNDNGPPVFDICTSTGGEDDGIDFRETGATRVVRSSIGEGRHVALSQGQTITFELDQPVRFCAVDPDNITLFDTTDSTDVPLTGDQLQRVNLTDASGEVVASRIVVTLPGGVQAGHDYQLTLDSETLGLDGEFQQNAGTSQASNGTLPSGNGTGGGDFVQIFRAVGAFTLLTSTQQSAGLALDTSDNLYLVSESGVFGPFDASKEITEGDRLGANLPSLAKRPIVINNDGRVVVKDGSSNGILFEVDPSTGQATQIATANVTSHPDDLVVAPAGYFSVERSAVEPGDLLFSNTATVSVVDVRSGEGRKGDINLFERAGLISDAYVSLTVPPAREGQERVILGAYKPEENTGFEMHRILPNGVVDRSVFTNPSSLIAVDATAVVRLDDIQGREEYLILGRVDTSLTDLKQLLPDGFDGVAVMIYNETESRLSVLTTLPLDTFDFSSFGLFSDVVLTSDLDRADVSLPSQSTVVEFFGLSNGANAGGSPVCDPSFDDDVANQLATGSARVFRSTLGNGRHLLKGAPTVLQFEVDQVVPLCAVNADNITLRDTTAGQDVSLAGRRIKRRLFSDNANNVTLGSRIIIDLPSSLTTGNFFELTLDGAALGLDGEFASGGTNGFLPSGDGNPGGDFVQVFQLIEGDYFLTETGGAAGVDLNDGDEVYAATATNILGPFRSPATPGPADTLTVGNSQEISGQSLTAAGKPFVANDSGGAIATYASLRNSRLYDADKVTGITQIFQTEFGSPGPGSFEIDLIEAPAAFAGDYILTNLQRVVLIDSAAGTSTTLFPSNSQLTEIKSMSVTPPSLGGPEVYVAFSDRSAGTFEIVQSTALGGIVTLFPAPLSGVTGEAGIRIEDAAGSEEYMILGDFDATTAQLRTGQIRDTTTGTELIIYNPKENRVQVISSLSLGADMTFTQDLDTVYSTHPSLRAVLRFQGFAGK